MTLKDLIQLYRKEHNLSQRQFASLCDLSNGYISMIEKGINPNTNEPITPTLPALKKIAKGMKLTLAQLLTNADEMPIDISTSEPRNFANNITPPPQLVPKPRLGAIACGTPILAEENHETTDFVPADIKCDFTLECKGDSMIDARILDGDIVYIRSQPTVENGEIAAVLVNSNEATLKRVFFYANKVMLQPANPNYEPLVFVNEEINQIKIIGKAVGFTSKLK